MQERLQKILAHAGIASRRKCEMLISEGRVTIDGVVSTELGTKADPKQQVIAVDGVVITMETPRCIVLHKPTSYVSTVRDPEGRRTVVDLVTGLDERMYPIGRLDYDTSGVLLLTNDGELTQALLHPKNMFPKVYRVTVIGMMTKEVAEQLRDGVNLDDGRTSPAEVHILRQHPRESVIELTIYEGKNRQVRRMMDFFELPVKRLKRIAFGPIVVDGIQLGKWRDLTSAEWQALYRSAGLTPPSYMNRNQQPRERNARGKNVAVQKSFGKHPNGKRRTETQSKKPQRSWR